MQAYDQIGSGPGSQRLQFKRQSPANRVAVIEKCGGWRRVQQYRDDSQQHEGK